MADLRAVIFDFDGLIVDTESVGYHSWRSLFEDHGEILEVETYAAVIGTDFGAAYDPRRDLEARLGRALDWEALEKRRLAREREMRGELKILPGVLERLEEAASLGLPCAIASSSPRSWVEPWLRELGLWDHYRWVTTVDDTGRVKPDPSLFLLTVERLGVAAGEAIIFEDSLNGLMAAKAAAVPCIVAPGPMTRHLSFDGALRRVENLNEIRLAEVRQIFQDA